jgi:hypothetical protein
MGGIRARKRIDFLLLSTIRLICQLRRRRNQPSIICTCGWRLWAEWQKVIAPHNHDEIDALNADRSMNLGNVRVIGRRRPNVDLSDPIESISANYVHQPLLRESAAL